MAVLQVGARVVVIDCIASNEAEWRHRLEQRAAHDAGSAKVHKPQSWDELQQLLAR